MIAEIFPQGFQRYQSLPVLGPLMDRYADWLRRQQYTWRSTRYELRMASQVPAKRQQQRTKEPHIPCLRCTPVSNYWREPVGRRGAVRYRRTDRDLGCQDPNGSGK
jgi:hypothetical protein